MPRGIEACRSPARLRSASYGGQPQVRPSQGVPRAVFVGLLRAAPGGLSVSGARPCGRNAYPPLSGPNGAQHFRPCRLPPPVGPQWRAAGTPGRRGLDRREGHSRRISDAPFRPPLPAPRPETLIRRPSRWGGMKRTIIPSAMAVNIPIEKRIYPRFGAGAYPGRFGFGFRSAPAVIPAERCAAAREPESSTPCPLDRLRRTGCPLARA